MRKIISLIFIFSLLSYFLFTIAIADSEITVSGLVKDGISNQPLPDTKVYLTVQSYTPSDKQKIEYSARTTTDAEGQYQFMVALDTSVPKRSQYMQILVAAKGYIGTIAGNPALPRPGILEIKHNFGLLPEGKEATVKGIVRDAVTHLPLSNIPFELSLSKSDNRAGMFMQSKKETRKLVTDANGNYISLIPSEYVDRINATSRWMLNIQSPDYDIAVTDVGATDQCCSRDTTEPEPDRETNIAMNVTDYYLVSKTAAGKLEGTLLDVDNKPSAQTKLRIEIAPTGAMTNMADMGGG
jgi:hypothetical protein